MNSEDLPLGVRRAMLRPTTLQQPVARTHQMPIPEPETGLERVGWVNSTIAAPEAGGALIAKDENPSAYSRFFPCVPPTASAQQKGVFMAGGKPRFFTKSKMKKSQKALAAIFAPHRPSEPFCGPIRVQIVFIYPWRKAESKHTMAKYSRYPIEQRPDVENQAKGALDVLTECRFWYDDSQISTLTASKYRGDVPGIEILIQPEHGEPK